MDQIDHVAARVTSTAIAGFLLGISVATYRGLPLMKTAFSTSASCAICGTACFGSERIVYQALNAITSHRNDSITSSSSSPIFHKQNDSNKYNLWISHSCGGILGGSLCGGIFQRRPVSGALLFTPIMLSAAFLEFKIQSYREERLADLLFQASQASNGSSEIRGDGGVHTENDLNS